MSHSLGAQQNYTAYLLLFIGIVLIAADCKFTTNNGEEDKTPFADSPVKKTYEMNSVTETNTEEQPQQKLEIVSPKVVSTNPYDIPDDF
jgi:hypothetical protein